MVLEMSSKVTPKIKTPQLRMFERSSEIEVLYGVGAICNVIIILFNLERVYVSLDYFHIDIIYFGIALISTIVMVINAEITYYRPQRSCEGYVFTGVCLSTVGGVCLSACWDPPQEQTHPWEQTHTQVRHPPGQTPPRSRHPPQVRHTHPPKFFFFFLHFFAFFTPPQIQYRRRPLLRTVRILLECILVLCVC